ncbi:SDR family NAD(P)-dependent oxidoreductase [Sphingosinicella soli]|uniref:NAD(P)-dependent dehydrogenase (Short-subunit alcohol dehydrogenase family) n=1 Tax=Sphingosinicella soli TaxID=333708 RepID=A0A7W7F6I3_9SPHN|nr:SDR family NAD(P)-dependent oxidoreductase [Sphingosinicella soli]MBB4631774.1 NAD(P)-dependent dehydrogenase (short-subunit alcohol dehydrogenase family) [Sphingosinicella soli]
MGRKVAFVTGAARGIGRAIAMDLAQHGFDLVLTARSLETPTFNDKPGTLREVAAQVEALGGRALPIALDLLEPDQIRSAWQQAIDTFGRIDVLVTSGNYIEPGPTGTYSNKFVDVPWDAFDRHARITGLSCLYLNQLAVKQMMTQKSGVIMNVTQNASWLQDETYVDTLPLPGEGMPGMAVAVMRGITDRIPAALKREVDPFGITIVTFDPGMTISVDKGLWEEVGTIGYRPEIAHSVAVPARAATYLATSPDARRFSGKLVSAIDLVREHTLLTEEQMFPDWQEGIQDVTSVPPMSTGTV